MRLRHLIAAGAACLASFVSAQPVTPPPIAAKSYALVDTLSGQTLAAAGADERIEPGSLTKLMTEYVVLDAVRAGQLTLDRSVSASAAAAAAPGGRMFLSAGQSATIADPPRRLA